MSSGLLEKCTGRYVLFGIELNTARPMLPITGLVLGSLNLVLEGRCPAEFSANFLLHTCLDISSIPSKTLISGAFN